MRALLTVAIALVCLPACVGSVGDEEQNPGVAADELVCFDRLASDCPVSDLPPEETMQLQWGGCWITGGGHIGDKTSKGGAGQNDQDSFGFNAMGMKHDYVRGEIQDTTHLGDDFHGEATWIHCWKDAGIGPEVPKAIPNNAEWGGPGTWNHADGYTWKAHLADRAEGGHHLDEYELWVWDEQGVLVYSQTAQDDLVITGGNFQIHPPNNGHPYLGGECATSPGCPKP